MRFFNESIFRLPIQIFFLNNEFIKLKNQLVHLFDYFLYLFFFQEIKIILFYIADNRFIKCYFYLNCSSNTDVCVDCGNNDYLLIKNCLFLYQP